MTGNDAWLTVQLAKGYEVRIISGEGDGPGTMEVYTGKRTLRAIRRRLSDESCDGDRWAYAVVYSHTTGGGVMVGVDIETCGYVDWHEDWHYA